MYSMYDAVLLKCMCMNADILCVCVHGVLVFILILYQADCVWYTVSTHYIVHVYIMHNM